VEKIEKQIERTTTSARAVPGKKIGPLKAKLLEKQKLLDAVLVTNEKTR